MSLPGFPDRALISLVILVKIPVSTSSVKCVIKR